jgi:SAM-dependent methyltransferase
VEESSTSSLSSIYNEDYYSQYGHNGVTYKENNAVLFTLQNLGQALVNHTRAKTHLDIGCAFGALVMYMRQMGVESYGFDFSEYAIKNAFLEARPFVKVASLLEYESDKQFDLVTCVEVVEHLMPEDEDAAIDKICSLGKHVYFSSENNPNDPTHYNANPLGHWIDAFRERGYVSTYAPSIGVPHGRLFVKAETYKDLSKMLDDATRNSVQLRDKFTCFVTGKKGIQVHEIVPRSAFGKRTMHLCFEERNLVCLCPEEHEKAHTVAYRKMLIKMMQERHGYTYDDPIYQKYLD